MSQFYNVGRQSLDDGLDDFQIIAGFDYIIILEAPSNANIQLRLHSITNPQIPLFAGWQLEVKAGTEMFLSCDAVAGGVIKYGQADGNLKIQPNPTINVIDKITEVGGFSDALLLALGKTIHPLDFKRSYRGQGNLSSVNNLITTTFKEGEIILSLGAADTNSFNYSAVLIFATLESLGAESTIASFTQMYDSGLKSTLQVKFKVAEGDILRIWASSKDNNDKYYYNLDIYEKKV